VFEGAAMEKHVAIIFFVVAIVIVVVGVDFVFFRERFWERLMANIGIVLVFVLLYWIFFRQSP